MRSSILIYGLLTRGTNVDSFSFLFTHSISTPIKYIITERDIDDMKNRKLCSNSISIVSGYPINKTDPKRIVDKPHEMTPIKWAIPIVSFFSVSLIFFDL